MAGILDSKERILDFIITQEGKKQAGLGELKVKFASFTDLHTFYERSGSLEIPDLADDASSRIFFESYSRYQDVIVPELEAGTSLRPFKTQDFNVAGGLIASGTLKRGFIDTPDVMLATSSNGSTSFVNGLSLEPVQDLLNGITQNFTDLQTIATFDEYAQNNNFVLQPQICKFVVDESTDYLRTSQASDGKIMLENVPSMFNDFRFQRFPNFLYLPPENMPFPGEERGSKLAEYFDLNENGTAVSSERGDSQAETALLSSEGKKDVKFSTLLNWLQTKQKKSVNFVETSRSNNIVCQFFEAGNAKFDKLSVIDYGEFPDENPGSPEALESPNRRVFFVGKIRKDSTGSETFVCLFTVVID